MDAVVGSAFACALRSVHVHVHGLAAKLATAELTVQNCACTSKARSFGSHSRNAHREDVEASAF